MPKAKFDVSKPKQGHLLSTESEQSAFVKKFNNRVDRFVGEMNEFKIPDFGSTLFDDNGSYCVFNDNNTIISSTIAGRISSKFERPNFASTSLLKDKCSRDWINFEQHLQDTRLESASLEQRGDLYRGRDYIAGVLGSPKAFLKLVADMTIDLGPGEQFVSKQGDVSLFTKLDTISAWTVTRDCAPMAALVIASNRGFRRILIEKWFKPKKYEVNYRRPVVQLTTFAGYPKDVAYFAERVLNEFFYSEYGETHLLQHGARGTSVYKNLKERRFINIECLWNVICQQLIGKGIRHRLKKVANNDLQFGQWRHKRRIRLPGNTTADFSKASDSNRTDRLRVLLHPLIFNVMDAARSHFVLITSQDASERSKAYYPIEKFSSMGNGFTFELLTLTILGMARIYDPTASVYGDDLICDDKVADKVISSCRAAGFELNPKKSFVRVPLRESCGGFYLDNYGYITCYDVKWSTSIADCFLTINKIGRIVSRNESWSHSLKDSLRDLHCDLLSMVKPCFMGPPNYQDDLPLWVEVENARNRQMRSSTCKTFSKERVLAGKIATLWQYSNEFCVTYVPHRPKSIKLKAVRHADVKSVSLMYTYLKDCRVSDMMMRVHDIDGKIPVMQWKRIIIFACGGGIHAGTARMIIQANQKSQPIPDIDDLYVELDKRNEELVPTVSLLG